MKFDSVEEFYAYNAQGNTFAPKFADLHFHAKVEWERQFYKEKAKAMEEAFVAEKRKTLELQRVYEERGRQIARLESRPADTVLEVVRRLIKAKGRHHTKLTYLELVEVMKTIDNKEKHHDDSRTHP